MKKYQANLLLFLISVIWGGGFIFVEILLDCGMSPGMITMFRGLIFAVCAFILYFKHIIKATRQDLKVGLIAGVTNALGFILQAIGQSMTSPSHASLITVTYVIFVPIFAVIFYKIKPGLKTLFAVLLCVIGAFMLVNNFSGDINGKALIGDGLVLAGAAMFGLNMAYLGHSGKQTHYGVVSFYMGLSLFVMSAVYVLATRTTQLPTERPWTVVGSILYLGLLSSTLCQILQVVCQRHTSPVSASMILTLEGFFGGVLAVLYKDPLEWNLIVGGVIILIAVLVQEIDIKALSKKILNKKE